MTLVIMLLLALNPGMEIGVGGNIITIDHRDGTYTKYKFEEISEEPVYIERNAELEAQLAEQ